ncbi:MAG: hypothetical protein ACI3ZY_05750, partial [Parabacteroides sp.]
LFWRQGVSIIESTYFSCAGKEKSVREAYLFGDSKPASMRESLLFGDSKENSPCAVYSALKRIVVCAISLFL